MRAEGLLAHFRDALPVARERRGAAGVVKTADGYWAKLWARKDVHESGRAQEGADNGASCQRS